jgi:hypothetical protein
MPAPLSTTLLVLATLLVFSVSPWAGVPVAALALLNEAISFALLYGIAENEEE